MTRQFWFFALALVTLASAAGASDLGEVQDRGVLRVIVWRDNLPELYAVGTDSAAGLEQEILSGFARMHKVRLELVAVANQDDRIPALLADEGDLVAGGLVNTERRGELVAFTSEVFPIRHVVVTRRPHRVIENLDQLRAERIGTIKLSSWAEEVARAGVPEDQVADTYRSAEGVLDGLRAGEVSAVVMSAVWAVVEQRKDPDLQIGMFLGAPSSIGFALRRDEPRLLAALDDYIGNLRKTSIWGGLVVKYFGEAGLEIFRRSREP